jgi:hypothetical protein
MARLSKLREQKCRPEIRIRSRSRSHRQVGEGRLSFAGSKAATCTAAGEALFCPHLALIDGAAHSSCVRYVAKVKVCAIAEM